MNIIITTYIDEEFGKHFQVIQMNSHLAKILGNQKLKFYEGQKTKYEQYEVDPVDSLFIVPKV